MNELPEIEQRLSVQEKAAVLTEAKAAGPEKTIAILRDAGVIQEKSWWRSIGINGSVGGFAGALAILIAAVAKMAGVEVDVEATELVIAGVIALGVSVATWWGRVHAVQPISRTQVMPGVTLKESRNDS
jgi:hypothetical protein